MRRGVYFGVSAAVAVAGAGLVLAAPVTRPLPNVHAPAIELSSDSSPKIDQQYLQWWQIVTGETGPAPSLSELNELDLSHTFLQPSAHDSAPVTLDIDGFAAFATDEPQA